MSLCLLQPTAGAHSAEPIPNALPLVSQPHVIVLETNAFAVNDENYIVVNDTEELEKHSFIEFYVSTFSLA